MVSKNDYLMTQLELTYMILALVIWIAGFLHSGRFVRPKWKIPGKLFFYLGLSYAMVHWFGHWALLFIIGHPLIGLIFHIMVCKKSQINWLTCEPREKYIQLQEKWAKGDFGKSSSKD